MNINWFQLHDVVWEGLDLRFTHFYYGIVEKNHPSGLKRYDLNICSPEYEETCIPLTHFTTLEAAQSAAEGIGELLGLASPRQSRPR